MIKKIILHLMFLSLLILTAVTPAFAQEETLSIKLNRDFGFGSGTGQIQGQFSVSVRGPDELVRVTYYLDGQVLGEATEAPFRVRFSTDSFPPGIHTITAVGVTPGGQELNSNEIRAEFVTSEQAYSQMGRILIPVLVIIVGAILFSALVPLITGRKAEPVPLGTRRKYGTAGGAICRRCGRPFSRNFLSPNLLFGKLERCPHCGKWAIVPAAPMAALRAAEQAEIEMADETTQAATIEKNEEERLRKELENSKYEEL